MTEKEKRSLVVSTGRRLLKEGLVVRTWGNVSCRVDGESFLITPSGLDYLQTAEEDLALYHMSDGSWDGPHKPSSEKGIHASAYQIYPDAEFVIHTHQAYATALGLYGWEGMDLTEEEREQLGGIAAAAYGLPGTKMLKKHVRRAMKSGAHTILLAKHGALIIGNSRDDACEKAKLLEEVCRRNWLGQKYMGHRRKEKSPAWKKQLLRSLRETYPHAAWAETEAALVWSKGGKVIRAQLDDMAQMIGGRLPIVTAQDPGTLEEKIYDALSHGNAVLVRGFGAVVNGKDEDDTIALSALVDKACITALHTNAAKVKRQLSSVDDALMHAVYQKKYSKLK